MDGVATTASAQAFQVGKMPMRRCWLGIRFAAPIWLVAVCLLGCEVHFISAEEGLDQATARVSTGEAGRRVATEASPEPTSLGGVSAEESAAQGSDSDSLADIPALEALGKRVFFDRISEPATIACVSCHDPVAGWTLADSALNAGPVAALGAVPGTSGQRKPSSIAYASFSPVFGDADPSEPGCFAAGTDGALCSGGLFWDGRATGTLIGTEVFAGSTELADAYGIYLGPLADQALSPFGSAVEHNAPASPHETLSGATFVCEHVAAADYVDLYVRAWGAAPNCAPQAADLTFKRLAIAIAAWESSAEVNSFSSRRDWALANDQDSTPGTFPLEHLTAEENRGHDLFFGLRSTLNPAGKDARCHVCHNSGAPNSLGDEPEQLYTDHRYHHLGLPPNTELSHFSATLPDRGLAAQTSVWAGDDGAHEGYFRTPTLRNVAKRGADQVRAYMHNGYFKRLEDVVHFYNTAAVKVDPVHCPAGTTAAEARARDCWPAPELDTGWQVSAAGIIGDLQLTSDEERALVAFLETLTDEESVVAPVPFDGAAP